MSLKVIQYSNKIKCVLKNFFKNSKNILIFLLILFQNQTVSGCYPTSNSEDPNPTTTSISTTKISVTTTTLATSITTLLTTTLTTTTTITALPATITTLATTTTTTVSPTKTTLATTTTTTTRPITTTSLATTVIITSTLTPTTTLATTIITTALPTTTTTLATTTTTTVSPTTTTITTASLTTTTLTTTTKTTSSPTITTTSTTASSIITTTTAVSTIKTTAAKNHKKRRTCCRSLEQSLNVQFYEGFHNGKLIFTYNNETCKRLVTAFCYPLKVSPGVTATIVINDNRFSTIGIAPITVIAVCSAFSEWFVSGDSINSRLPISPQRIDKIACFIGHRSLPPLVPPPPLVLPARPPVLPPVPSPVLPPVPPSLICCSPLTQTTNTNANYYNGFLSFSYDNPKCPRSMFVQCSYLFSWQKLPSTILLNHNKNFITGISPTLFSAICNELNQWMTGDPPFLVNTIECLIESPTANLPLSSFPSSPRSFLPSSSHSPSSHLPLLLPTPLLSLPPSSLLFPPPLPLVPYSQLLSNSELSLPSTSSIYPLFQNYKSVLHYSNPTSLKKKLNSYFYSSKNKNLTKIKRKRRDVNLNSNLLNYYLIASSTPSNKGCCPPLTQSYSDSENIVSGVFSFSYNSELCRTNVNIACNLFSLDQSVNTAILVNQDNYVAISAPPSIIYGICNSNGQWLVGDKFLLIVSTIQCLVSVVPTLTPSLFIPKDCCFSIVQTQLDNFVNGQLSFLYNDNLCKKYVTIICTNSFTTKSMNAAIIINRVNLAADSPIQSRVLGYCNNHGSWEIGSSSILNTISCLTFKNIPVSKLPIKSQLIPYHSKLPLQQSLSSSLPFLFSSYLQPSQLSSLSMSLPSSMPLSSELLPSFLPSSFFSHLLPLPLFPQSLSTVSLSSLKPFIPLSPPTSSPPAPFPLSSPSSFLKSSTYSTPPPPPHPPFLLPLTLSPLLPSPPFLTTSAISRVCCRPLEENFKPFVGFDNGWSNFTYNPGPCRTKITILCRTYYWQNILNFASIVADGRFFLISSPIPAKVKGICDSNNVWILGSQKVPARQINCLVAPSILPPFSILPPSQKPVISPPLLPIKQTLPPLPPRPTKLISPYDIEEKLKQCCPYIKQSYRTWKGHKNGKAEFSYNSDSCRTRVVINCTAAETNHYASIVVDANNYVATGIPSVLLTGMCDIRIKRWVVGNLPPIPINSIECITHSLRFP